MHLKEASVILDGLTTPDGRPQQIKRHNQHIGKHSNDDNKSRELARTPCPFQVFSAVEDGGQVEEDGEDVLFNKGGREEGPRIEEELRRNEGQVGNNDRRGQGWLPRGADLAPSGDVVEEGEGEEADETGAGCGRNVDTDGHIVKDQKR